MFYGYARATVDVASVDDQAAALKQAGCTHVFIEQASRGRTQLALAIQAASFGDALVVTSLDRLAFSVSELLTIFHKLAEKGAGLRSLSESVTDPATEQGRHFAAFVAWCVAFDAATFAERMKEGRSRAAAAGVTMGRPTKLTDAQKRQAVKMYLDGEGPLYAISAKFDISAATLSRIVALHQKSAL